VEETHKAVLPRLLAQVGAGAEAAFVVCGENTACPAPTPKTLVWAEAANQPPVVPATPRAWIVTFGTGGATLTPQADEIVRQAAAEFPKSGRITIISRADDTGPRRNDHTLALTRATTVRDRLLQLRPELENVLHVEASAECERIVATGTRTPHVLGARALIVSDPAAQP
jgi:hypothetical protein